MKNLACLVLLLISYISSVAQVNEIRSLSTTNHHKGLSNIIPKNPVSLILFVVVASIVQENSFENRKDKSSESSVDLMLQTAAQPASYYIVNPRVRLNCHLFSTDLRLNYWIEEDIEGIKNIYTVDWQVLQINFIDRENMIARVGGGIMHEGFSGGKNYAEWTAGFNYHPQHRIGAYAECRITQPRKEVSVFAHYKMIEHGVFHSFVTAGITAQQYLKSINTWGIQGGLLFKLY
jgi:hypothetical protein